MGAPGASSRPTADESGVTCAIRAGLPFVESTLTEVEIDSCRFLNDANLLGALYQLLLNADEEMAVNV